MGLTYRKIYSSAFPGTTALNATAGSTGNTTLGASDAPAEGPRFRAADRTGGIWKNTSGKLVGAGGATAPYLTDHLLFDATLDRSSGRMVLSCPAGLRADLMWCNLCMDRASNTFILFSPAQTGLWYDVTNGALGSSVTLAGPTIDTSHDFVLTVEWVRFGAEIQVTYTFQDDTAASTTAPYTFTVPAKSSVAGVTTRYKGNGFSLNSGTNPQFTLVELYEVANPKVGVFCIGDSRTYGAGLTGAGTATGQTYPAALAALLGPTYDVFNLGVGGLCVGATQASDPTKPGMIAGLSALTIPLIDRSRPASVFVVWVGVNDVIVGGEYVATGAEVGSQDVSVARSLRAAGAGVVLCTEISATGFDAAKAAANATIRSEAAGLGSALADLGAIVGVGTDGSFADAAKFQDQIHPTAAATPLIAAPIAAAVPRALPSSGGGEVIVVPANAVNALRFGLADLGAADSIIRAIQSAGANAASPAAIQAMRNILDR